MNDNIISGKSIGQINCCIIDASPFGNEGQVVVLSFKSRGNGTGRQGGRVEDSVRGQVVHEDGTDLSSVVVCKVSRLESSIRWEPESRVSDRVEVRPKTSGRHSLHEATKGSAGHIRVLEGDCLRNRLGKSNWDSQNIEPAIVCLDLFDSEGLASTKAAVDFY